MDTSRHSSGQARSGATAPGRFAVSLAGFFIIVSLVGGCATVPVNTSIASPTPTPAGTTPSARPSGIPTAVPTRPLLTTITSGPARVRLDAGAAGAAPAEGNMWVSFPLSISIGQDLSETPFVSEAPFAYLVIDDSRYRTSGAAEDPALTIEPGAREASGWLTFHLPRETTVGDLHLIVGQGSSGRELVLSVAWDVADVTSLSPDAPITGRSVHRVRETVR